MFEEQSGIGRSRYGKVAADVCSVGNQTESGKEAKKIRRLPSQPANTSPHKQREQHSENGTGTIDEQRRLYIVGVGTLNRQ
jgi:hypothetical protein